MTTGKTSGQGSGRNAWRAFAEIVIAAIIFLIPSFIQGRPTVFYDTDHYYSLGEEVVGKVVGFLPGSPAPQASPAAETSPTSAPVANETPAADTPKMSLTYMGGRSPYYGAFLYALEQIGTVWLVALVQALAIAFALHRFLTHFGVLAVHSARRFLSLCLLAATLTTGGLYAGYTMPDIFAPVTILLALTLSLQYKRLGRFEAFGLAVLLGFAIATHNTHLVIAAAVILGVGVLGLYRRQGLPDIAKSLTMTMVALVAAVGAQSAYKLVSKVMFGDVPHNPPYLMARVLADGPGRSYLWSVCDATVPDQPYQICASRYNPLDVEDQILWSADPRIGVFSTADYATRVRLREEQSAFLVGTFKHDPIGQIAASFSNAVRQFFMFGANEAALNPSIYLEDGWAETSLPKITPNLDQCAKDRNSCAWFITEQQAQWIIYPIVALGLMFIAFQVSRPECRCAWRRPQSSNAEETESSALPAFVYALAILLFVLLVNAAICGIMSGPHDRYQARVMWLVPVLALASLFLLPLPKAVRPSPQSSAS